MTAPTGGLGLGLIVFAKILAMFVVLFTGFFLRRGRAITDEMTATLSQLITDLIFPALVIAKLIDLVSWQTVRESASVFIVGAVILLFGIAVAGIYGRLLLPPASRRSGAFLVAIPNWIFMPLPIVQTLYGPPGVRALLLINVSMQFILWTCGIWMLQRGVADAHPLDQLRKNRGLQATAVALVLGIVLPAASSLPATDAIQTTIKIARALLDGIDILGSLTIPLSLLVIGAQLGGLSEKHVTDSRTLGIVIAGRLLVLPILSAIVLTLMRRFGLSGPEVVQNVALIIVTMPIAVTCGAFLERFNGDVPLGARAIFLSTIGSIVTVPAIVVAVQHIWK